MKQKTNQHLFKCTLTTALIVGAMSGYAAVESDLVCAYAPSTASAWGGEANARVNMANGVLGSDALNDQSGTGQHLNIVGYIMSSRDSVGEDNGYVLGLVAGDGSYADVRNYAGSVGADQVVYVPYASTGAAGNAYQPGTYSAINSTWWWLVVVAHETGGHNYGLDHGDGHLNPKTIMLHNYCGGGAAWPYLYSNPNVWDNGVNMLGDGATSCTGSFVNGGDGAYGISSRCQGMCDTTLRVVYAPVLNKAIYHWCFTNTPGSAPAGTTNYDLVSGAPAAVRGNGATYTGGALRLPGGTTGNVAMSSMSAYVDLPNGIISSQTNLTIEIWATPLSAPNYARIMDFGNCGAGELAGNPGDPAPGGTSQTDGIMLTADIGTDINQQRFEAQHSGSVYTLNSALATTPGVQHCYTITFTDGAGTYGSNGGRWQWYRDGDLVGFLDVSNHLADIQDVNNWLGRSEWSGDNNANNDYTEVRISNVAMNQFQVKANYLVGPNFVPRTTTMVYSDEWGNGVRSFNTAGAWSDGLAPSAGKSYDLYDFNLITPNTTTPYTFAGDSLHASGGIFFSGASGSSTITVNKFQIDNEEICNGNTAGGSTLTLAGNLYVTNNNIVRGSLGPVNVSANLNGNGSLTLYANRVSLAGNNANYTGKIRVGNGMTGALNLSSEAQLGANPASFTLDQLILNRGWLYTTTSFAINNSNRGITIGVNDGIFDESAGTTLTLGCPLASGYQTVSGNQLTTQPMPGGVVAGVLWKQNAGTLVLTNSNPNYNGAIGISGGTLSIAGAGQLGGGNYGNPITDNGVFDYSSSAAQAISSAITGTGSITKNGTGTLTLSGANTYTGTTTVNGGMLSIGASSAPSTVGSTVTSGPVGTGTVVLGGGTLSAAPFGVERTIANSINVVSDSSVMLLSSASANSASLVLNGKITGNGNLGLGGTLGNNELCLGGTNSAFAGTFTIAAGGNNVRLNSADATSANAAWVVNSGLQLNVATGPTTYSLGSLSGFGNINGHILSGSSTHILSVGALNTSTTFSGTIVDNSANNATTGNETGVGNIVALTKVGIGTLTLSGANTYSGATTINGGMLLINGSIGSGAVTVSSGGTLGGNGIINGTVTVQNNGILSPGASIGKLTVSNNVTLQPSSTTMMEISKTSLTNDQLRVTGTLNYSGTLQVTNLSGTLAAGDSFTLFSFTSRSGTFATTNLPVLNPGLGWSFNPASGVLSVIQTVATNSTNISFSIGSGNITLNWPADHTGWRLQSNTNLVGTNWLDVAGSIATNSMILPVDYNNGSLFYRLVYP